MTKGELLQLIDDAMDEIIVENIDKSREEVKELLAPLSFIRKRLV